jgi:hypothetical protein
MLPLASRTNPVICCAAARVTRTGAIGSPAAEIEPEPGADKLTAYQDGPQVWVRWNNAQLTGYRAHATQKYPYFFPLAGPLTGLSLTTESSVPYPHHRSVLLACDA